MAFQPMTASDATGILQTLEFIADGGNKKLTESVGNYAQVLSDKKAMEVAKDIKEHFSEALAEKYMSARDMVPESK